MCETSLLGGGVALAEPDQRPRPAQPHRRVPGLGGVAEHRHPVVLHQQPLLIRPHCPARVVQGAKGCVVQQLGEAGARVRRVEHGQPAVLVLQVEPRAWAETQCSTMHYSG